MSESLIPWCETGWVLLLSAGGALLGWRCARLAKRWWLMSYLVPLLLIVLIGTSRRFPRLELWPPFSWLMAGRTEFALTGLLGTMILTTLLPHLPKKRERIALVVLMLLVVGFAALPPFAAPLLHRTDLSALITYVDENGICRQSTDYSCGPAAAVTALRRLGWNAEEGELARWARTTRFTGTEPDVLALALQKRYGPDGLQAEYRHFDSVAELRGRDLVIARIKFSFLLDHYVTVLQVTEHEVITADPLDGLTRQSHATFAADWRFCGIVLSRTNRPPAGGMVPSR